MNNYVITRFNNTTGSQITLQVVKGKENAMNALSDAISKVCKMYKLTGSMWATDNGYEGETYSDELVFAFEVRPQYRNEDLSDYL